MFGVAGLRASLQTEIERESRFRAVHSVAVWSALYALGHVLGGAIAGGVMGGIGGLLPVTLRQRLLWGLGPLCLLWALQELGLLRLPMPQLHRQVQRNWMRTRPWNLVALGYGLQLGCGIATRVPSAATYATLSFALLSGAWWRGAGIMAVFGLMRAWLPVAIGPRVQSPEVSMHYAMWFNMHQGRVKTIAGAALIAAGLVVMAGSWWRSA